MDRANLENILEVHVLKMTKKTTPDYVLKSVAKILIALVSVVFVQLSQGCLTFIFLP